MAAAAACYTCLLMMIMTTGSSCLMFSIWALVRGVAVVGGWLRYPRVHHPAAVLGRLRRVVSLLLLRVWGSLYVVLLACRALRRV